jgi:methyl-accepting chemotaxis protein
MKIGGKIYALVAVLSAVALVIGGTALFAVGEYSRKLDEYRTISTRAYLGERLNRYVTAVVMESRGIYHAKSTDAAAKFASGLTDDLTEMDKVIAEWTPLVPTDERKSFDALIARSGEFKTFRTETARLGTQVSPAAADEQGNNDANRANRKAFQKEIDAVVATDFASLENVKATINTFANFIFMLVGATAGIGILAGISLGIFVARVHLTKPIVKITNAIRDVSEGNFEIEVPYTGNKDELGEMAAAVEIFKQNGRAVRDMNVRQAAFHQKNEDLQARMAKVVSAAAAGDFSRRIEHDFSDANLNAFAGNVDQLVANVEAGINEIRAVMSNLAESILTRTMNGRFEGAFAELQTNVNSTLGSLIQTIREVLNTSDSINGNIGELSHSTGDLSKRTEQQAAALEETSAALQEITAVVRTATQKAQEAAGMVNAAKDDASRAGQVVGQAIDAMGRIEQASREISQIINVIDEISFQTNLLALNAGVEAARAGEAGKGFAVVAQEVRELAQRAAGAAKDIKALITKSGNEVKSGVSLVQATGTALSEIETRVLAINSHIHAIAESAREQATGLAEINQAVNQIDQVTQQNAAMVEETSAATVKLSGEADRLVGLISRFELGGAEPKAARGRRAA